MPYDHQKIEGKTLEFWKQNHTFQKSIAQRKKARSFVFYEGPPTANGRPGIHHVLTRVFKDLMCRYKTMQGFQVVRKAGWDTHGLPVELEVEKKQGFKTKQDIEKFGVGRFNALCKKSVWEYKQDWEKLTERIGFWVDVDDPYITYDPLYMESLFSVIKGIWDKGLLYEGHKVLPWCPRCGTALSSHEVAQGYKDVTEDSVYVKFKLLPEQQIKEFKTNNKTFILAWTTTPWTLPGNVALAVGEKIHYVAVKQGDEIYIIANDLVSKLKGDYEIIEEFSGKYLESLSLSYEPLFNITFPRKSFSGRPYTVATADFVTTEGGTGVVHTAVMYGEDDYQLGEKLGLPKVHTVTAEGKFNERVPQWQGRFVKSVEKEIIADLQLRNLLYKTEPYTHSYPFCWRCSTPLLYYARTSWYVAMSKLREKLIASNKKINWVPDHLKEGRFGEWLKEVKDWAFSRERYWGTPLPLWRCDKGHIEVIGSRSDLAHQKFRTNRYTVMRHGYSNSNHEKYLSCLPEASQSISHLTKKGIAQVKKTARTLKKKKIDIIIASNVTRTRETAEIVGEVLGIKPIFDARICEVNGGVFNGRPLGEYHAFFKDQEERFTKRPEGGETFNEVKKRMLEFIKDIDRHYQEKNILIVSHGVPISTLESAMRGFVIKEIIDWRQRNEIETGEARDLSFVFFPYNDDGEIDFHKPFIDEVEFNCKECGSVMRRVPDVVDVWFDSGAMPFAQNYRLFHETRNMKHETKKGNVSSLMFQAPRLFPADYICEAIDQTRGWFYTLLAVSTVLDFGAPYRNVISTGHVLDEKGEKMSKSKGNAADPWTVLEKFGADATRWYFYTVNAPGEPKLFAQKDVEGAQRRMIGILWNSLEFLKMYQSEKSKFRNPNFKTISKSKFSSSKNVLDRWITARLHRLIVEVTKRLEDYDVTTAARAIEAFAVEDLSQWYIRRSRRRFQKPDSPKEKDEAVKTLRYVLGEFSKLCAPFLPFISEEIYKELVQGESVHLADWPKAESKLIDKKLLEQMDHVRLNVSAALKKRTAIHNVRQPIQYGIKTKLPEELLGLIEDELNVRRSDFNNSWVVVEGVAGTVMAFNPVIPPNLKEEGIVREIVRNIQDMRKEAGYRPQHHIQVFWQAEKHLADILSLQKWQEFLARETLVDEILQRPQANGVFDREREVTIEGQKLWIGVRRI